MSSYLAKTLDMPPHSINRLLAELEGLAGYPSEDVRLQSELVTRANRQCSALGLDPADSSAEEMYYALQEKYGRSVAAFGLAIGEKKGGSGHLDLTLLRKVMKNYEQDYVWALKKSAARKLLRSHPPRRLMKTLGYRSAESMVKREDPLRILIAASYCETKAWRRSIAAVRQKITTNDIESTPIKLFIFDDPRWAGAMKPGPAVTVQPDAGSVAVWPGSSPKRLDTLGLIVQVLEAFEVLNDAGLALKFYRTRPDFGPSAAGVWRQNRPTAACLAGHAISWRAIRHHYSQRPAEELEHGLLDLYETAPSVAIPADVDAKASTLHPSLGWWKGCGTLVFKDKPGQCTSLSLADAAANDRGFTARTLVSARRNLTGEIFNRYLSHPAIEKEIKRVLLGEQSLASPEQTLKRLKVVYNPYLAGNAGANV